MADQPPDQASRRLELLSSLADPGYTPARRDIPAVVELLCTLDRETARHAERALMSSGISAGPWIAERLPTATEEEAIRLIRVLGRLLQAEPQSPLFSCLLERLDDERPRVKRSAIVALGKTRNPICEAPLLALLGRVSGPEQKALIEALGKTGALEARERLSSLSVTDPTLLPFLTRARLLLERSTSTADSQDRVRFDCPLPEPWDLLLLCRWGLVDILTEQLAGSWESKTTSRDCLRLSGYQGPLLALFRARSLLTPAFPVSFSANPDQEGELAEKLAERLCEPDCLRLLETLSTTRPRLRLEIDAQGHRRALAWAATKALSVKTARIAFDPRCSLWRARLILGKHRHQLWLIPRRFDDHRFTYRVRDVPASSHPTVAAALAHRAGTRPDDRIWDPFVGSGLELLERTHLGTYRALFGTDIDPNALEAARLNANAKGVTDLLLERGDCRMVGPRDVTTIITCPPFGLRVVRDGTLELLLEGTLRRARQVLCPGGRMVWLSPRPEKTAATARELGFAIRREGLVDVGGLRPELQILTIPEAHSRPSRRNSTSGKP